jgi:hypothetical protein
LFRAIYAVNTGISVNISCLAFVVEVECVVCKAVTEVLYVHVYNLDWFFQYASGRSCNWHSGLRFSVVLLTSKANTVSTNEFHIALLSSYALLPMLTSESRHNAMSPINNSKFSCNAIVAQLRSSVSSNSPLLINLPASLLNILPCLQPICTSNISRHYVETFRAVCILCPSVNPVLNVVSLITPTSCSLYFYY